MANQPEKDELTGVETTGHEWDGMKELNNPAPRWWLWVFFVTVVWSIGYWVIYPAWPTLSGDGARGGTPGTKGWTQYTKLADEQAEIAARRGEFADKIKIHSLEEIQKDPELYAFAVAGGRAMFKENCSACHGTGAEGLPGYPNLNDDDWLWGGSLKDIYTSIKHGVRSTHAETRTSQMPAFGGMLKGEEIDKIANYVLSLNPNQDAAMDPNSEAYKQGTAFFTQNCAACHGADGKGNRELGAPNLADAIWLYGDKKAQIVNQIKNPRHGVMPTWEGRLSDDTIKQLTVYVHSLGGGEAEKPAQ